jgi:hypothetical protein
MDPISFLFCRRSRAALAVKISMFLLFCQSGVANYFAAPRRKRGIVFGPEWRYIKQL